MRKLIIVVYLFSAFSLHALDLFSDVVFNAGYLYNPETPLGFNVGVYGLDLSMNYPFEWDVGEGSDGVVEATYSSHFAQISLTYGFKIFDWLRIPLGISLYADSVEYSGSGSTTVNGNTFEYESGDGSLKFDKVGFNMGAEFLINPWSDKYKLSLRAHTINFKYLFLGAGVAWMYTPPSKPSEPKPKPHPTITPQELRKVELAYAETAQTIKNRGKNLYVNNRSERAAFIQRYQGSPNMAQVNAARNTKLPYYSMYEISQEEIVRQARNEPNEFLKVRMIHDWVADVFAYDNDLLWWMNNVSGRNAEFTLGQIINRQRGVCYEYAILFWFLLDSAGLDVYL